MGLKRRLEKLEKAIGPVQQPVIVYREDEKSKAEALAEWEAENGPIGDREPMFVIIQIISPSDNATSERKGFRNGIKEPA
jgi:hypothetical protein